MADFQRSEKPFYGFGGRKGGKGLSLKNWRKKARKNMSLENQDGNPIKIVFKLAQLNVPKSNEKYYNVIVLLVTIDRSTLDKFCQ